MVLFIAQTTGLESALATNALAGCHLNPNDGVSARGEGGSPPQATGSEASLRQSNSVLRMAARPSVFSSDSIRHRTLLSENAERLTIYTITFVPYPVKHSLHIIANTRNGLLGLRNWISTGQSILTPRLTTPPRFVPPEVARALIVRFAGQRACLEKKSKADNQGFPAEKVRA